MKFGKHKGKTFLNVLLNCKGYSDWVDHLQEGEASEKELGEFRSWLHRKDILKSGKHKGKTFLNVLLTDNKYTLNVYKLEGAREKGLGEFQSWLHKNYEKDEKKATVDSADIRTPAFYTTRSITSIFFLIFFVFSVIFFVFRDGLRTRIY